jgi:hypothetical protein
MSPKRPSLMDKDKFVRMLATDCAEKIFSIMENSKSFRFDAKDRAFVEECHNLARARYIEIKLEKEQLDNPSPLEIDLWLCLISYELMRREETGRNGLSTYTRRNIVKHGVKKAVEISVIRGKFTYGKSYLIENDLPEHSFEKVVLKYAEQFDQKVVEKAVKSIEYYSEQKRQIFDAQ